MEITFYQKEAKQHFPQIRKEIKRLEKIFNLYDSNSSIRTLNRDGLLTKPPKELLEVLSIAQKLSQDSQGVFDISIASRIKKYYKEKNYTPIVDYTQIQFSKEKVYFKKKGMSITLNALAQGYLADYFYTYLKNLGIKNALINTGEYKALGTNINSKNWQIYVSKYGNIELSNNKSLAISTINNSSNLQHPKYQLVPTQQNTIIVIGSSACIADGLATTLSIKKNKKIKKIYPNYNYIYKE